MQAIDYIDSDIPFLKDSDTIQFALDLMAGNAMTDLPVVRDRKFLGIISDDVLLNLEDLSTAIGNLSLDQSNAFILEDEHVFELIRKMIEQNLYTMPVVSRDGDYVGITNTQSIIRKLGSNSSLMEPGGMIVLEMNKTDYSLTEIARIVESNDALILNCFISSHANINQIEVTLKINKTDLEDIIVSFERYEYVVKASYHQSSHKEDLQQRFDSLMHYLNM
ncbi:MAG: CBS domain-containing protein [Bacteroidetes bacterium]|nr:CBS domain-containing protein [Bacteroidota bacterium]